MSTTKKKSTNPAEDGSEEDETILQVTPKEGIIDTTAGVTVKTTDKAPFHKKDQEILVSKTVADKMKANGWAV